MYITFSFSGVALGFCFVSPSFDMSTLTAGLFGAVSEFWGVDLDMSTLIFGDLVSWDVLLAGLVLDGVGLSADFVDALTSEEKLQNIF